MKLSDRIKEFQFGIKHIILIFVVTFMFLAVSTYINNLSKTKLFNKTTEIYRHTSIENLVDLTATSLELLLEQIMGKLDQYSESKQNTIHGFDMILSQQALRENIKEICVLVFQNQHIYAIDNGHDLYAYYLEDVLPPGIKQEEHQDAIDIYTAVEKQISEEQNIYSFIDDNHVFQIIAPIILKGGYSGALYMRIGVDYRSLIKEISIGYSNISIIFTALIMLGLLSMFYLSSYMVKERDVALRQLFEEQQVQLKQNIELQKEQLFARRIYHTHHKAEKIMGYIKKDLRNLLPTGFEREIGKILKFASYIQRVIYDMKSFNPPVNTIRNPAFQSDINEIIQFIVNNVFGHPDNIGNLNKISTDLDGCLPLVHINEYVIWEILEPLFHNSIDHNPDRKITISITTHHDPDNIISFIIITDDGVGIDPSLLTKDENGVQKLFLEHTTKKSQSENSGYGCYIAYQICNRCAWKLIASNAENGGAQFNITIPHTGEFLNA
ncbi:MAG: histidine kinase [Planctomycetia bacterium]|nr:histidine kinase [Planctomycetia bacterium]